MKKRLIFLSAILASSLILSPSINTMISAEESSSEASSEKSSEQDSASNKTPEIKEVVLFDEKDIKVTAKSLEFTDQKNGAILNLLIENNSKEDLNFIVRNANLNRVGVGAFVNETLAAGKKSKVKMDYYNDYNLVDINKTAIIDFNMSVSKNDDTPYVDDIPVEIKTNLYKENESYLPKPFYDKDQIKIYNLGLVETKYDKGIALVFENDSDKNYSINSEETYLNGFSLSSMFIYLDSPSKSYTTVFARINDKSLKEADLKSLDEIEEFELKFSTTENNDYSTKKDSDLIKLNLKSGEVETETEVSSETKEAQSESQTKTENSSEVETSSASDGQR